ncbi:hypothetical protein Tco_0897366 [Tanacetum coccineum]
MELKTSSSFKITGLLHPWQTLCKIFSKCLTTRVTGWDQPPLQIMQMMYCFVNNIHVDYAELLWEGLYYSLHHPISSIPYPRFTKIIISHYMTSFPEISRRARDRYHNLKDDEIMKNIFNSGRYKDKVGMQIPDWMISEEMKHTEHYRMYAEVFRLDVPLTQSQPTESTQGTHRTLSAPRSPNPKMDKAESSAPKRSTVIRFRLLERRSTRLTPLAPVPIADKADEMILQDTLQVSIAEHKSQEEQEARENVELVKEHLVFITDTRLEPRSDKESPEVEITNDKEVEITNDEEVEITNVVIPVNDDPHDDAHPEGENRAKRQKTSEYEAYVSGESSSGQVNENEQGPSTSGNQEQEDDYDFWTESYASDDDEIPTKQMSQDIMEEVSLTIDEAKLKKMVDEMLRQRCTSGDEHQYHIDQMKNFLKSDIVWESRKEILVSPHPRKTTPLVQSCQRDPEAPPLSLINQDLLYLKKGSSGLKKIVCVKKFNPYARYDVEHWKNPHVKIFYIRKQKEPGKPKEVIYSNSKIIQVIKTYWELGHEHKFITKIVARRANECIVSITEPDYKNLNKNDIEDMYLLIMNGKVPNYVKTGLLWSLSVFIRSSVIWERVHDFQLGIKSYQQKINLTTPTISFPGVEKHKMFSIIYEP